MDNNIFYNRILDYDKIEENLVHIFYDSIITDTNFIIIDISQNVLDLLSYTKKEVVGNHLKVLFAENSTDLVTLLINGYFSHSEFQLKDSEGNHIEMFVSGYYMGLISDINGKVVILVKSKRNIAHEKKKLEKRFYNLNDFIYRTSHDIGGPVATIKGLALVGLSESNPVELHKYLEHIFQHAEKLDLLLEYIREIMNKTNWTPHLAKSEELKELLFKRLGRQSKIYAFKLLFHTTRSGKNMLLKVNNVIVAILVENIILVMKSFISGSNTAFKVIMSENSIRLLMVGHNIGNFWSQIHSVPANSPSSNYNYIKLKVIRRCMELTRAKITNDLSQLIISFPVAGNN